MKKWQTLRLNLIAPLLLLLLTVSLQAQPARFNAAGVSYTVELYTQANYPIALDFAPDGRLFYTEKTTGSVRVINADGSLQPEPVITLPTSALVERGLLGIALDPAYASNGMIWVLHTAEATARDYAANRVVRFHEADGVGSDPEVMLSIPLTENNLIHNGGNLHFDKNGYLYLTIGDYENAANAQDLSVMPGKIHRFALRDEGLVPAPGNPFSGENEIASIYAYGLRNSFDFAFDTKSDYLFATENGLHCDDEVNIILRGFNYGHGENYTCGKYAAGINTVYYRQPLLSFTPTIAPTGIIVYDHPAAPAWQDNIFFCSWTDSEPLRMLTLDAKRQKVLTTTDIPLPRGVQCRIDIAVGPEGGLYFTTVNENGGAIYRLLPE